MKEIEIKIKEIKIRLDKGYTERGQIIQSEYPKAAEDLEWLLNSVKIMINCFEIQERIIEHNIVICKETKKKELLKLINIL